MRKTGAGHADHVADIDRLPDDLEGIPEAIPSQVELNASLRVAEVREGGLSLRTPGMHPPRDTHHRPLDLEARLVDRRRFRQRLRLALKCPVRVRRLDRRMRPVERVRERGDAVLLQHRELLAARAQHRVEILLLRDADAALLLTHRLPTSADTSTVAAGAPCSLRYAWMNGSIAPSITFWTSGIFSSVRWSLTIVYGWKT